MQKILNKKLFVKIGRLPLKNTKEQQMFLWILTEAPPAFSDNCFSFITNFGLQMSNDFSHSIEDHNSPTTDAEKIDALLDLLADPSKFTGDPDFDLVMDSALAGLLHFSDLPPRTEGVMLGLLAVDDHSDLTITRKIMATEVLRRMGQQAKFTNSQA